MCMNISYLVQEIFQQHIIQQYPTNSLHFYKELSLDSCRASSWNFYRYSSKHFPKMSTGVPPWIRLWILTRILLRMSLGISPGIFPMVSPGIHPEVLARISTWTAPGFPAKFISGIQEVFSRVFFQQGLNGLFEGFP